MLKKPCRKCGKPGKAICDACGTDQAKARMSRREQGRPTARMRGYTAEYDRNKKRMLDETYAALRNGYGVRCILCAQVFKGGLVIKDGQSVWRGQIVTAEHIVPIRRGGTNDYSNLGPAHSHCNTGWNRAK